MKVKKSQLRNIIKGFIAESEAVDGLTSQINNFKNAFNFMNAANFERIFRDNEKEKGLMV